LAPDLHVFAKLFEDRLEWRLRRGLMNGEATRSHCRSNRPEHASSGQNSLPANQQAVNAALIEVSIFWINE
jgi:hypothetical protein